ncbi:hypothetical protein B0H14DRAFT_2565755 [Mycena olivaceomarginata]|nr:hypothetical protein B0H14DRAFT_2565755 [Mycena olivaceomarginata]
MTLFTITRSPTARVYNLRFLSSQIFPGWFRFLLTWLLMEYSVFKWPMLSLAVIELGTIVIEIGVLVSLMPVSMAYFGRWMALPLSLPLGPLLISLVFRLITVFNTEERVFTQRFVPGMLHTIQPPYTPLSIILNCLCPAAR